MRYATVSDLYEIATYLSMVETHTEIHAELPTRHQVQFETEYTRITRGFPLPPRSQEGPYYVWPEGTNKYGRELRIYFARVPPEPPPIQNLYTDHGRWYARSDRYRVNHSNLVMQLFECGFVLGLNADNQERIAEFMRERFPVVP